VTGKKAEGERKTSFAAFSLLCSLHDTNFTNLHELARISRKGVRTEAGAGVDRGTNADLHSSNAYKKKVKVTFRIQRALA
jgi:hypothetical protein